MMPHAKSLLRFALRLRSDRPAAEDLVQETLLHAWRGFAQFERDSNARAWLFRILINTWADRGRKIRTAPETVQMTDLGASHSVLESLEVRQALAGLPEEHRTVLLLGVVEGFTSREIAEILSVPIGTVMSRLSRARQSLREKLAARVHCVKGF